MRLRHLLCLVMLGLLTSGWIVGAQSGSSPASSSASKQTGYAAKKPVFGGGCRTCPWGAMGEIVRKAMEGTGWDVQLCYNCAGGPEQARGVADARVPKPIPTLSPGTPYQPPNGPEDFGATGPQYLYWAYKGTHDFAKDPQGPRNQLRVIANIMEPRYYLTAVKADSGITDLRQIAQKKMPVRIVASGASVDLTSPAVLAYYGLTKEALESWGGKLFGSINAAEGQADVFLAWGSLDNTPEYGLWYQISQKYEIKYLELPADLRAKLVKDEDLFEKTLPFGALRGIEKEFQVPARTGTTVYGRTDMPDAFAYALAKALDEKQDLLQWANGGINFSYNTHTVWKVFDMPLHPGAERYYKEKGYMK